MDIPGPHRVVIAHHYPPLADLIRERLGAEPGWEICGVAYTGAALRILIASFLPDILILDVNFETAVSTALVRSLAPARPELSLLLLTANRPAAGLEALFAAVVTVPPTAIATQLLPALHRLAGAPAAVAPARAQGASI